MVLSVEPSSQIISSQFWYVWFKTLSIAKPKNLEELKAGIMIDTNLLKFKFHSLYKSFNLSQYGLLHYFNLDVIH